MKKYMISAATCLLAAALFFSSCELIFGSSSDYSDSPDSVTFDLKHFWDITLPQETSPLYIYYDRGGFRGEGDFYCVYDFTDADADFFASYTQEYNEEVQERILSHYEYVESHAEYYESRNGVLLDREWLPDFEEEFVSLSYHKGSSKVVYHGTDHEEYCDDHLYVCYFPERKRAYFYESIT